MRLSIRLLGAIAVAASTFTAAHAQTLPPEKANPVVVPKFDKPPVIDGKLDEEVWQKAAERLLPDSARRQHCAVETN